MGMMIVRRVLFAIAMAFALGSTPQTADAQEAARCADVQQGELPFEVEILLQQR